MRNLSIGVGLAGPPSACSADPDRVDVFAVGTASTVWCWSKVGANWLPAPVPLPPNGTIPAEGLCAIASGPGREEVFAIEKNSRRPVWWRGNAGAFTVGPALASPSGAFIDFIPVAAVATSPNDIDVFAVASDKAPWWWHWNGTGWSVPVKLPTSGAANLPSDRIAVVSSAPGRLDVFAVGTNTHLWHWSKVGAAPWSQPEDLGGNMAAEGVSAVSWGAGRIDVFAASRAAGNPLLHWWLVGGTVAGPENLGGDLATGTVSAVSHAPNRLDVFAITRGQQLLRWQWNGRAWRGPSAWGERIPAGDVSAVVRNPHRLDVFLAGAGNILQHWPFGGLESARSGPWINWPTNQQSNSAGILRPDNLDELVNIVKEAEQIGRHVRAVGTGWSNSDAAVTDGYVVETDLLNAELTEVLSTSLAPAAANLKLVHVEAGIKLNALIRQLFDKGLALNTVGGSSGQSLAGALSTSVHGMDVNPKRGPLPEMVRAIHLVGPGGVQHWIEPSTGAITNRQALKNALGLADENIHYDDDWFNSVLVSMGSIGIIYSLIIEAVPRYALRQVRVTRKWPDIRASLAGGVNNPLDTNRGVQVAINPYLNADGTRDCYLTTRNEAPLTGLAVPTDVDWEAKKSAPAEIEYGVPALARLFQIQRNLIAGLVRDVTADAQKAEDRTAWIHDLAGGSNPGPHTGRTVEFMFDAGSTAYLEFVDAALEIIRKAYYDESPNLAFVGWISLRFQGRSRAYLSPQRFNRTCSIEFVAVWKTTDPVGGVVWPDTPTLISRIEARGREFGGVQHWGLNESINANDVASAYPRLDTWRRIRWELTRGGTLTTFDSDFTRRCGLSAVPNTSPALPGLGKDIGAGADGSVWLIGTNPTTGSISTSGAAPNFGVYKWDRTNWLAVDGGGVRIAVGPDGTPWLLNSAGQIFHRQGNSWGAPLPGLGKDIGVGADGSVWLIGTNPVGAGSDFGVYKWNGANWVGVDGGGVRIAVAPDGTPWLLNSAGQIFHRQGNSWGAPLPGLGKDIGVGADGSVWLIGTNPVGAGSDFGVYKWNSANWVGLANNGGVCIAVDPSGRAWLVNAAGQIFRRS